MDTHFVVKTRDEQLLEARYGEGLESLLRRLYDSGLTQQSVADEIGVHRVSVVRWMKRFGIPTRDRRAVPERVA